MFIHYGRRSGGEIRSLIGKEAFDRADIYAAVKRVPVAMLFAKMGANPPANAREGVVGKNRFVGFLEFMLGSQFDEPPYVGSGRAAGITRWGTVGVNRGHDPPVACFVHRKRFKPGGDIRNPFGRGFFFPGAENRQVRSIGRRRSPKELADGFRSSFRTGDHAKSLECRSCILRRLCRGILPYDLLHRLGIQVQDTRQGADHGRVDNGQRSGT